MHGRRRRHAFTGWHPAVTEMVGATDVGTRWALHDLAPLDRWHTDRVVLMGDAAHAMVPHQGQGANQTIEDAIVLADCLADCLAASTPQTISPRRCSAYTERGAGGPSRAVALTPHRRPDAPPRRSRLGPPDALFGTCTPGWPGSTRHDAHADPVQRRPAVGVAQGLE